MKRTVEMSELQLAVMRAVWSRGEASTAQVQEALRDRGLAATTIATLLSRLEKRGLLAHRSEGRQFIYRSAVSEQDVTRSMVSDLTRRLFAGDAAALVSHLINTREFRPGDLERVRILLEANEKEESRDAD